MKKLFILLPLLFFALESRAEKLSDAENDAQTRQQRNQDGQDTPPPFFEE